MSHIQRYALTSAFVTFCLLSMSRTVAGALVEDPKSQGLNEFPEEPAGYDYLFSSPMANTLTCPKSGGVPGYISSMMLTTDTFNRLVGISFTCATGSQFAIWADGRTAARSTDTVQSATAGAFGFNYAVFISGAYGEVPEDGSDIVSGAEFGYVQGCVGTRSPGNFQPSTTPNLLVSGGSDNLYFNPSSKAIIFSDCFDGDKFVGFTYSVGGYFNALSGLLYAF